MKYYIIIGILLLILLIPNSLSNPIDPTDRFSVLFIEETSPSNDIFPSADQIQGMDSVLIDKFVADQNGLIARYDKDLDTSNLRSIDEYVWFDNAMQYFKKTHTDIESDLPYVMVSKGSKFREGKVKNLNDTLKMLDAVK